MNANIRKILTKLVADNGAVTFDDEFMSCKCCHGKEALGPESFVHDKDCIVELAKQELQANPSLLQ